MRKRDGESISDKHRFLCLFVRKCLSPRFVWNASCNITRNLSRNAKLNKQTFIITLIIGMKKTGNIFFGIDDSAMMIIIEYVEVRVTINHPRSSFCRKRFRILAFLLPNYHVFFRRPVICELVFRLRNS